MSYALAATLHMAMGAVGLLGYWAALSTIKGSAPHRAAGKTFFVTMLFVTLSLGPVLLLRPGAFDLGFVVQLVYLSLCLMTVCMLGWTAILWKHDPDRFRGGHLRVLGPVLFALGLVVLASGLARRDPVPALLSWVGLFFGAAMMRFAWMRSPLHPRWWLNWHLTAVCLLFSAVHGSLMVVAWRWVIDPEVDRPLSASLHLLSLVLAIGLRLWFGHHRGVPIRFAQPMAAP
jgi:hypothetical protein